MILANADWLVYSHEIEAFSISPRFEQKGQLDQNFVQQSGFLYSILGPACHNTSNNSTNFLLGILVLMFAHHLPQQSYSAHIYWIA
jgi:hypothetical protein